MPDITMCATQDCPLALHCHRNKASGTNPSDLRQSWSGFQWVFVEGEGIVLCDYFWPKSSTAAIGAAAAEVLAHIPDESRVVVEAEKGETRG